MITFHTICLLLVEIIVMKYMYSEVKLFCPKWYCDMILYYANVILGAIMLRHHCNVLDAVVTLLLLL